MPRTRPREDCPLPVDYNANVNFDIADGLAFEFFNHGYPVNVSCPGTRLVWSLKAALSLVKPSKLDLRQQAYVVIRKMTAIHSTVHYCLRESREKLQKCIDELLLCHATEFGKKFCAYNDEHKWTAKRICVNGVTLKTHSKEAETYLENALLFALHDPVLISELDNSIRYTLDTHLMSLVSLYHLSIPGVSLRHFGFPVSASLVSRFVSFYTFADDDELRVFMNNLLERVEALSVMISNPMREPYNIAVPWFIYSINFIHRYVEVHPMEVDKLWPRINIQEYADATRMDYISVCFFCSKIIAHLLLKWRLAFAMRLKARAPDDPRGPNNSLVRMLNPEIVGMIYGVPVSWPRQ
jgi:hypothetical protein